MSILIELITLADLSNNLEVVRSMRIAPVMKEAILQLAAATLVPILPLGLTVNAIWINIDDITKMDYIP
jgi:hypothetical protein